MDKAKDIAYAVFVKHMFWTLSVVIVAMGVLVWWKSAGSLQQDYSSNKGTVTAKNDEIKRIADKPIDTVVNAATHEGMREMNDRRRREVYRVWKDNYDKQRRYVLVWPDALSQRFRSRIEDLLADRPIEEVNPTNEDGSDRLVAPLREEYRNKIKNLLPELAASINARWNPTEAPRARAGAGGRSQYGQYAGGESPRAPSSMDDGEMEDRQPYAVVWSASNQGDIERNRFDWSNAPAGDQLPSTTEILYSMEDYWVLKAVMQVIADTNTDEEFGLAELPHQAAIREIHFIDLGKEVSSNEGRIYRPAPSAASRTEASEGPVSPAPAPAPARGMEGEAAGRALAASDDPAEGRYVAGPEGNYQPISAAKLKSATDSDDPAEAYLAVAKRMPVRMKVKMDQRKINKFLIACGNADLMLEVKQMRINPSAPDVTSLGGSSAGAGPGAGGRPARGGIGRTARGGDGQNTESADGKTYPWDVDVEVYGIIYIFNPPSMKRLTAGLDAQEIAAFHRAVGERATAAAGTAAGDAPADGESAPAGDPPSAEPPADIAPPAAEARADDETTAPPASG